jgi:hypothetical protein
MSPCKSPIAITRPGADTRNCGYVSSADRFPACAAHERLAPSRPLEKAGDRCVARVADPPRAPRAHAVVAVVAVDTLIAPRTAGLAPPAVAVTVAPRVAATARTEDARALSPPPRADACRVTTAPRREVARIANDATRVSDALDARRARARCRRARRVREDVRPRGVTSAVFLWTLSPRTAGTRVAFGRYTMSSRASGRDIALGDDFKHEIARGDELASTRGAGVEFGGRIDELGDERFVRLEKLERVRRAVSLVSIELHAVIAQSGCISLFVGGVGVEGSIEDGSNALGGIGARNVAARGSPRLADGFV